MNRFTKTASESSCFLKSLVLVLLIVCFQLPVMAQQSAAQKYIEAHKERAVRMMKKYDVPASIILGVAIHESAFGNSKLARYLNNHFGIKGPNSNTEIKSAYKDYDSIDESYMDFVNFLQKRKQFRHLFEGSQDYNYEDWALGIAKGGYASSKAWPQQVIGIIEKYDLDELDQLSGTGHLLAAADAQNPVKAYIVKPGDTLSEIAQKFNTTVDKIKHANQLRHNRLQIGQELSL